MENFKLYRGEELTIEQCRTLLSHPKNGPAENHPSPEEVLTGFRKYSDTAPKFFILYSDSLVAHAMAGECYKNVMTVDDFWADDAVLNLKFYRSTRRTPGYEIFLRCLDWGIRKGFDEVTQPLIVGKQGKRAWDRWVDSGLLIPVSADKRFHCKIPKTLPELLDLS